MENPSMCEIPIDPRDPPSGTCCARGDAPRPCGAEDFFSKSIQGIPDGFPIVNSGSICFNGGEYSGHIQRFFKAPGLYQS